jgi:hypothetical protein
VSHWWDGTREEIDEYFRQQWEREAQLLAFFDEVGGRMTRKALAAKFNLKPGRVCMLVRRHVEQQERAQLHAKVERLEQERTFTSIAERLWMDLGWLATELEKRATTSAAASSRPGRAGSEATRSSEA